MKRLLFLIILLFPILALSQYPNSPNKIRLGNQTTGDGLVFRGSGAPAYTPTGINNAWIYLDTVAKAVYIFQGGAWHSLPGGIFAAVNNFDTIRVSTSYIRDAGWSIVDTTGDVNFALSSSSATLSAGNAVVQAVKPLGYLLIQGDSLLFSIDGSFGSAGQVITATGNGGAFWQDLPPSTDTSGYNSAFYVSGDSLIIQDGAGELYIDANDISRNIYNTDGTISTARTVVVDSDIAELNFVTTPREGTISIGSGYFETRFGTLFPNNRTEFYQDSTGIITSYSNVDLDNGSVIELSNKVKINSSTLTTPSSTLSEIVVKPDSISIQANVLRLVNPLSTGSATDAVLVADNTTGIVKKLAIDSIAVVSNDTIFLSASSGTPQAIVSKDTIRVLQGIGITTTAGATDQVTVSADTATVLASKTWVNTRGFPAGSGTAGRLSRWITSTTLGDSGVSDDSLGLISILGTRALRIPVGTTAQRSATPVAGELRRNTTTGFSESYDGTVWRQADFPTGTSGQTLRHNGSIWGATSNLFNNGTNIGINSTSPNARLHVVGDVLIDDASNIKNGFVTIRNPLTVPSTYGNALSLGDRAQTGYDVYDLNYTTFTTGGKFFPSETSGYPPLMVGLGAKHLRAVMSNFGVTGASFAAGGSGGRILVGLFSSAYTTQTLNTNNVFGLVSTAWADKGDKSGNLYGVRIQALGDSAAVDIANRTYIGTDIILKARPNIHMHGIVINMSGGRGSGYEFNAITANQGRVKFRDSLIVGSLLTPQQALHVVGKARIDTLTSTAESLAGWTGTSGSGVATRVTLGSGLTLSGNVLSSSGGTWLKPELEAGNVRINNNDNTLTFRPYIQTSDTLAFLNFRSGLASDDEYVTALQIHDTTTNQRFQFRYTGQNFETSSNSSVFVKSTDTMSVVRLTVALKGDATLHGGSTPRFEVRSFDRGGRIRLGDYRNNTTLYYVDVKAPDTLTHAYTITLPSTKPAVGDRLSAQDTMGTLVWDNVAYGEIFFYGSQAVAFEDGSTFFDTIPTWSDGEMKLFERHGSALRYVGSTTARFSVHYTISMAFSDAIENPELFSGLRKNATTTTKGRARHMPHAAQARVNLAGTAILELAPTDEVRLEIAPGAHVGTDNINVYAATLTATKL